MAPENETISDRSAEYLRGIGRGELVTPVQPGVNTPVFSDPDESGTPVPGPFNPLAPAPGTTVKPAINDPNPPINAGGAPPPEPPGDGTPAPAPADPNQQILTALNQITSRLQVLEGNASAPPPAPAPEQPAPQIQGYDEIITDLKANADQFVENPGLLADYFLKFAERAETRAEQNALNRMAGVMPEIYEQTRKMETKVDAFFQKPENADLALVREWVERQASELRAGNNSQGNIIDYFDQAAPLIRASVGEILKAKIDAQKANPAAGATLPTGGSGVAAPQIPKLTNTQKHLEMMGVQKKPMSEVYPDK